MCDWMVPSDVTSEEKPCRYKTKYYVVTQAEVWCPANEYREGIWSNLSNAVCSVHLKTAIDSLIKAVRESETRGRHNNNVIVTHL